MVQELKLKSSPVVEVFSHMKASTHLQWKRTNSISFRASEASSEVCLRNAFKLHDFIYRHRHTQTEPINNAEEIGIHLPLQTTLHPSPLCSCTVGLANKLCSLDPGWVWPVGTFIEIRVREGNEIGLFIPWLPLHREGCFLLKVAFLTRFSPPSFYNYALSRPHRALLRECYMVFVGMLIGTRTLHSELIVPFTFYKYCCPFYL